VVIEKPFFARTKRSALLTFLVQELRARVTAGSVEVREYGPRQVREILLGNSQAMKRDLARFVVGRFPELERHLHLGEFWKQRYWSDVFDALGLRLAELAVRDPGGRAESGGTQVVLPEGGLADGSQ
jgi:Holliday junction resolvasome RuvABC endonuclease subunit